jgi:hypothetical protein
MMATRESTAIPLRIDSHPDDLESTARAALALQAGRVLSDREWASAAARLREFVNILRSWSQPDRTIHAQVDNVVAMRKIEPQ